MHNLPTHYSIEISSTPSLSFVELIIYILGSVSTWTGLSILDFNPASIISRINGSLIQIQDRHLTKIKDKQSERKNYLLKSVQSHFLRTDRIETEFRLRFHILEQKLNNTLGKKKRLALHSLPIENA